MLSRVFELDGRRQSVEVMVLARVCCAGLIGRAVDTSSESEQASVDDESAPQAVECLRQEPSSSHLAASQLSTKHLEGCTPSLHSPPQHLYYSIQTLELVTASICYLSVVTQFCHLHNASRLNDRRQVTATKPA